MRLEFSPWVGKIPGRGNGNPLQYSCPENPGDRGSWQVIVHGVEKNREKSRTQLRDLTLSLFHFSLFLPGKSYGQMSQAGYSPWGPKRVQYNLATKQQSYRKLLYFPDQLNCFSFTENGFISLSSLKKCHLVGNSTLVFPLKISIHYPFLTIIIIEKSAVNL